MENLSRGFFFRPYVNVETLKTEIQNKSSCELFKEDELDLNLLHHSILARNSPLVKIILQKEEESGLERERKVALPYLHLAAIVGCPQIAALLCRKFKVSSKKSNADWLLVIEGCLQSRDSMRLSSTHSDENFTNVLFERMQRLLQEDHDGSSSALDVAGVCGNTDCLKALLLGHSNLCVVNFGVLQRCIEEDSLTAFNHLTHHTQPSILLQCLHYFIKHLHLEAVKVLLLSAPPFQIHDHFNPYHLACVQSRNVNTTQRQKYKQLDAMFALFIEAGFSVNEKDLMGQYPLYSMLYSLVDEMDNNPQYVPQHHIKCLQLLISAGADPNYNEQQHHMNSTSYTERDLFSSALNAFFECLQSCETWSAINMEHLDRVCLLLLENGADTSHINSDLETPLHSLMRLAADQHTLGHLSADFFSMTRQLLYFGADPNTLLPNSSTTPICYYFKHLFETMGGHHAYDRWNQSEVHSQILPLLTYMDRDIANQSIIIINHLLDLKVSSEDGLNSTMADVIRRALCEYLGGVRSLQDCCKMAVWQGCNRKVTLISQLELPRSILREFNSFFILNF